MSEQELRKYQELLDSAFALYETFGSDALDGIVAGLSDTLQYPELKNKGLMTREEYDTRHGR